MASDGSGQSGPVNNTAVLDAFGPMLDALADRIAARLNKGRERMINQAHSELGPRRHRDAVKRRLANGEGGAGITPDGRKFLLTPEAVREELTRGRSPAARGKSSSAPGGDAKPRTRGRELRDFERDVIDGLRAVK